MSFRSAVDLGGSLKAPPSPRRFQVSKSRDEHGSEGVSLLRDPADARNPPPQRTTSDSFVQSRTSGSTGRFQVTGLEEPKESRAASEGDDRNAVSVGPKCVHFSVGEKADKHEDDGAGNKDESFDHTTVNLKSWRNMKTLEHPPIIDFYRNSVDQAFNTRPSMIQLIHGENAEVNDTLEEFKTRNDEMFDGQHLATPTNSPEIEKFQPPQTAARTKFGWIQGVFVRCLLNIFGVMLYLRVSWVAGQCGLLLGSAVVLLASVVTTITAISTCAICTNGDVKGGGAYFLISRSLGPEFGGSIGLIFSVANAVGAAMYVVGFAETVRDLMREYGVMIIDGEMNDVRIIGLITCCILMGIVFIGTGFESKMQMGLLAILALSIVNYMLGTLIPVDDEQRIRGITGYSYETMMENMLPAFRDGYNFFSVFAIYFPAATGIMAGANISGDLADPQRAIPLGTLSAIFVTTIIYLMAIWMTGSTAVRDADGINMPTLLSAINGTHTTGLGTYYVQPECAANSTCTYGLMNYFQVMETESFWGPLITAGIFAATLSSALASLVSAPKVFQAVCKDRLFPKIDVFAKQYGKDEEPRRAYLLGFVLAMVMILIGDLNAIAPIISNFFLASYALINYACFDASVADSPGFRPGFKYYNMWVSLGGALLCICVMFIISWWTALVTFFFFGMLFLFILHRKPDVNWGSSTQAHSYKNALQGMLKLTNTDDHVKNFRPQILVLSGNPMSRSSLVDFVYNISKGTSLMICGYVIPYEPCDRSFAALKKIDRQLHDYFKKRHIKSFYHTVANPSIRAGSQTLIQTSGLGKLKPNIVIIGFKTNWYAKGVDGLHEVHEYFGIIQDAFDSAVGVGVLRNTGGGLDYSEELKTHHFCDPERALPFGSFSLEPPKKAQNESFRSSDGAQEKKDTKQRLLVPSDETPDAEKGSSVESEARTSSLSSFADLFPFEIFDEEEDAELEESEAEEKQNGYHPDKDVEAGEKGKEAPSPVKDHHTEHHSLLRRRSTRRHTAAQKELLVTISRFQRKIKKGRIDVWWLYDDGGLTLLIPHLLTIPKSYLENAEMRVFTISTSTKTMEQEQRSMAALLSKFRIDFANVSVIPDIGRLPNEATFREFENLIAPFRCGSEDQEVEGMITDGEIQAQKDKTRRQLRTAELLQQHSTEADLVVITLPVPRKGMVSSTLYMAWLEMMTRNLPPTLMIRGNQQSVLTFYS